MDDIGLGDALTDGDTTEKPTLKVIYPLSKPDESLMRLERDLVIAKRKKVTEAEFAKQRFGHARGDQLSRHLRRLRQAVV